MAGDWIKVEHATLNKPEVLMAAELLNVTRREALGIFLDYWAWLDVNLRESCNGCVTHVYGKLFEEALQCPGLMAVLEAIGWAKYDPNLHTLTIIHHERHNGNTAKTRALTRDRVKRLRNDSVTLNALPEKRREEVLPLPSASSLTETQRPSGEDAPNRKNGTPQPKATRLARDWQLPDDWKDWAIAVYHLDPQRAVRISLAFRDYWIAKPGGMGTKLDWQATWRNWVRKEMNDA